MLGGGGELLISGTYTTGWGAGDGLCSSRGEDHQRLG